MLYLYVAIINLLLIHFLDLKCGLIFASEHLDSISSSLCSDRIDRERWAPYQTRAGGIANAS